MLLLSDAEPAADPLLREADVEVRAFFRACCVMLLLPVSFTAAGAEEEDAPVASSLLVLIDDAPLPDLPMVLPPVPLA